MFIILIFFTFTIPIYDTSTDQKYLKVSGQDDIIERETVIQKCSIDKLETLEIEEGIIGIGPSSFKSALLLKEVSLPINLKYLGDNCFEGCSKLSTIVLPEGLEIINARSLATSGLEEVTFPSTLKSIDAFLSFIYCSNLKKFKMPKPGIFSVDANESMLIYNKTIAYAAASGQTVLQFPDEIEVIGDNFANQRSVNTLIFSKERNLKEIKKAAFSGSGVKKFTLPEGLVTIQDSALGTQASYVWLPSTLVSIGNIFNPNIQIDNIEQCKGVYKDDDGILFNQDQTKILLIPNGLKKIHIPKTLATIDGNIIRQSASLEAVTVEYGHPNYFDYKGALYRNERCAIYAVPYNLTKVCVAANCTYTYNFAFSSTLVEDVVFEGENVTEIGYGSFTYCKKLKSLQLPDSIKAFHSWSISQTGLKSLRFPKKLQYIHESAFSSAAIEVVNLSECTQLIRIDLNAFQFCTMTKLVLGPNLQTIGTTVFRKCSKLTEVVIPRTVCDILDSCFALCTSLSKVVFESSSVLKTLSYGVFQECGLTEIVIPASVEEISQGALSKCPNLQRIEFEAGSNLHSIRRGAFTGTNATRKLVLPPSVSSIDEQSLSEMYGLERIEVESGCKKYKSVEGVIFTSDGVELVAFPGGMVEYVVSGNVERIANSAFFRCINLVNLTFEPDVPLAVIGENTFMECTGLEKLDFPRATERLEANCFCGCVSISEVSFASGSALRALGSGAFSGCKELRSVLFGEGARLEAVAGNAFAGCVRLESFSFPRSVIEVGALAFSGCTSLTRVSFEENSTLGTIGVSAFEGCKALTEVSFPPSVSSIGRDSFRGCSGLLRIMYCGSNAIGSESGTIFTGLTRVRAFVSPNYPSDCSKFGELEAHRWLDLSCNFPTGAFTSPAGTGAAGALSLIISEIAGSQDE